MNEIRILSPNGAIGYGFPESSIAEGMKRDPHVIAVDAGSTDPGPHYLGSGDVALSWESQKHDLRILMQARGQTGIPLIVGSAGLSGSKAGVDKTVEIVRELAKELAQNIKIARIYADLDKADLKRRLNEGRVKEFDHPQSLTEQTIDRSTNIVAQMGVEPVIEALKADADVIICGRAYDPAVFAAFPIMHGFDPALALHAGKILECGAYACEPSSAADAMFATIRKDHFLLDPPNPEFRCTPASVAAHTFYEKERPDKLSLPGGTLSLREAKFEAVSDRVVRVSGSTFSASDQYTVKAEGAAPVGYRSLFIAGARDPNFIANIDEITAVSRERIQSRAGYAADDYSLIIRVYGRDGVMGAAEPTPVIASHEIGIVGEVVAETQDIAHTICAFVHGVMLHYDYPGRKTTAGNLAFPYSPSDFDLGAVYEFSIYHLIEVDDPCVLFPISYEIADAADERNVE